jgi:hypothetical protein
MANLEVRINDRITAHHSLAGGELIGRHKACDV